MSSSKTSKSSRQKTTLLVSLITTFVGGFAIVNGLGPTTSSTSTGNLAKSQATEQKLLNEIGRTQLEVQKALNLRTAAVLKYANATGNATLLVKKQVIPKTNTVTKASGGEKNGKEKSEFDND